MAWNQAGNSLTSDIPSLLCVGVREVFGAAEELDEKTRLARGLIRRQPPAAPVPVPVLVDHAGLNRIPLTRCRHVDVNDGLAAVPDHPVDLVGVEPDEPPHLTLFARNALDVLVVGHGAPDHVQTWCRRPGAARL